MIDANAEVRAKRDQLQKELTGLQKDSSDIKRLIKAIKNELVPLNLTLKAEYLIVGSRWTLPNRSYYGSAKGREVVVIHKTETYVIYLYAGQPERCGMQEFLDKAVFKSLTSS